MKRLFVFLITLCILLAGCSTETDSGQWQPIRASAEIEPYARRAIEIIDEYLAFEMTSDEATKAFWELYRRISSFDIIAIDSEYNDADQTIYHSISSLSSGQAKNKSDIEYYQYRDLLSFQVGEPVSGKSYNAERSVPLDDDYLEELIEIDSIPFNLGSMRVMDDYRHGLLHFDSRNGVCISDLQQYIETFYESLIDNGITNAGISVYYSCFDQDVFCVSLNIGDGTFNGRVRRSDAQAEEARSQFNERYTSEEKMKMDGYPKEFAILEPLYEFDSIDDLPEALAAASAFAGFE